MDIFFDTLFSAAIYDITIRTKPGKEGTATVVLTKAKFQQPFKLPESE